MKPKQEIFMIQKKNLFKPLALLVGLLLSPILVLACMWDYDTLKMERSRFPSTLELITGKFLRHSPEFYEWRIKNRLKRLEADSTNLALLDDLAVAYDKTGQHDKAIETALNTEKIKPNRYETFSNLATFYFHAGKLEEGLPYIDKALKINPDAHFGREKYQKYLTEYVLIQRKNDKNKLPLGDVTFPDVIIRNSDIKINYTFENYLEQQLHPKNKLEEKHKYRSELTQEESTKAIKGVLGMLRFGTYTSPILLEALGSLLSPPHQRGSGDDGKLLACRAYLKASYETPEGQVRIDYQKMALRTLDMQWGSEKLEIVEPIFKKELEEAKEWYSKLRENELSWIRDGKNPEIEFDKLYDADPELSGGLNFYDKNKVLLRILGICFITISGILLIRFYNKKKGQEFNWNIKDIIKCLILILFLVILYKSF